MEIIDVINRFNNGDNEFIIDYFGEYEIFFKFLKKRNLHTLIDPFSESFEDWQNKYFLFLIESDEESFLKIVEKKLFFDVIFINGEPHIEIKRLSYFSILFCDNRYTNKDFIESFLDNEEEHQYFFGVECDVYDDVISNLTPENLAILKKIIIHDIKDKKIAPYGDLLKKIAYEQNSEYVIINDKNIDDIISDEKSTKFILTHISDLVNNLEYIYSEAYNSSYNQTIFNEILYELSPYFEKNGKWISSGKNNYYVTKIIDFIPMVKFYLKENLNYNTLDYYGEYLEMLKDTIECIRYQPGDYPDYDLIINNINEIFEDYY